MLWSWGAPCSQHMDLFTNPTPILQGFSWRLITWV